MKVLQVDDAKWMPMNVAARSKADGRKQAVLPE